MRRGLGISRLCTISRTEIIMNPSASHFAMGKYRTENTGADSSDHPGSLCLPNLVGLENGRMIYDGGVLIGECGKIAARGPFWFQRVPC